MQIFFKLTVILPPLPTSITPLRSAAVQRTEYTGGRCQDSTGGWLTTLQGRSADLTFKQLMPASTPGKVTTLTHVHNIRPPRPAGLAFNWPKLIERSSSSRGTNPAEAKGASTWLLLQI